MLARRGAIRVDWTIALPGGTPMRLRTLIISATLLAGPAFAADAPAPPPLLVRGTIASFDGKSVTITKADGTSVTGAVAPTTFFAAVEPRRFDQLQATDFVRITAMPAPHDTLKAEQIHMLPIHVGEGAYPWDHHADGSPRSAGRMT